MGDAQSAQREGKEDGVVDSEVVGVDDAQDEEIIEDKALSNNGQISGLNEKADEPTAEANDHCDEDVVVAEVCEMSEDIVSPKEEVPETTEPLKEEEETPLEDVDINEKESPDSDEATPPNMSETEAKLNEINEGFKTFFSNIGLKLTVKKHSGEKDEIASNVPTETNEGEPSSPNDMKDTAKETTSDNAEQNIDLYTAQETPDNDSTTCPTMTDMTSEDTQEYAEEKVTKMTEATEEGTPDTVVETPTSTTVGEEETTADKDTAPETTSPTSSGEEEAISPIKKFFTTGIFSSFRRKKKQHTEQEVKEETIDKELVDMGKHKDATKPDEAGQDQEQMKEEISPGVKTIAAEGEQDNNELKVEIPLTTLGAAGTTDAPENAPEGTLAPEGPSSAIVTEAELLSSQERVKVQGSPLKRLLSASSFKKLSKKQRARRSSDSKLTDSGEHASDHLLSSTESTEGPARSPEEVTQQEDSTWASFKKLVTPKKRPKRSSLSDEEAIISSPPNEPKPSEGEPISDLSTEETKKKMDSSGPWEAFLCGSGKRKGRKTSDSEDETPGEPKHAAESPLESSQEEDERIASSPERTGSPSEGDGASTWKSLKKLVTPKRKAKDEEESKEHIPSDTECNKDESSFSIKNLLPGRKKRKSADKQDQISSDEADRGVGSDEEDSETPAVVPLSEFDTPETEDHIQTQAVIESHIPKAEEAEPQQDQVSQQITEAVIPNESLPAEPEKVEDTLKELALSAVPTSDEDFEDLAEFISKHQQLSDIPEEGVIEESMATPGSVAEEAAIDDTIGEDLIELTSDAVTAPEPVDATLADETTEMVSAVSQLTESSKTSGNTTPVPAEYDEKETEALLYQVCETISVSRQILETSAQQEAAVLEAHQKSDATVLSIGLDTKEFDATEDVTATTKVESVSEVSEVVSTEPVSEDTTEEFETAGITTDGVCQADVSEALASAGELDTIDESQPLVECVTEAVSPGLLPVDETLDSAGISIDGVNQGEIQSTEMESRQEDSTAVIGETVAQTDQPEEEKDQIIENGTGDILEHTPVEDEDQIVEVVNELQALTAVHVSASKSEEGGAQVLEKQVISEDFPAPDADNAIASVTDEPMQGSHLTEVNVEGEKEDKLPAVELVAAEVEHAPVPEVIACGLKDVMAKVVTDLQPHTAVPVVTPDLEEGSDEALEKKAIQEDIPPSDVSASTSVSVEHTEETNFTEVEADNALGSVTDENVQDSSLENEALAQTDQALEVKEEEQTIENDTDEVPQHIEVPSSLEEGTVEALEKQEVPKDIPAPDRDTVSASVTVTDEHVQDYSLENEALAQIDQAAEVKEEEQTIENDTDEVPQLIEVPSSLEEGGVEALEKQEVPKDILAPDRDTVSASVTVTDERVQDSSLENEALAQTDQAPEVKEEEQTIENDTDEVPQHVEVTDEDITAEVVNELEVLTAVHVAAVNSEAGSVQVLEKQVISEEVPEPDTDTASTSVTEEHISEVHLTEVSVEGEIEAEFPGVEMVAAEVEYAPMTQVIESNVTEVVASIPDAAVVQASDVAEPWVPVVATELEAPKANESLSALPSLLNGDMIETAVAGNVVTMQHLPSVLSEDGHEIQVQVVDVDKKSAETIVETMLEVGVTDVTEVIDVCDEMDNEVENMSASLEMEEELIDEANKVITQEVTPHKKENLPEELHEPVVVEAESCVENEPVILEHKLVMLPAVVLQSSAIAEGELSEVEVKKVQESEKHPEGPADISVETEQVAEAESCVENEPVILEHELVMLPAVVLQSSAIAEGELSEVEVKKIQEDSSETLSEKHPEGPADISVETEQVAEAESCVENESVILEHELVILPAVVLQSSTITEGELSEVEVKKIQEDSSEKHPEQPANISVETEQVAEAESCVENEPVILEHELVMLPAVVLQSSAITEGELSEVQVKIVQEDSSETLSEKHPERPADISVETEQVAEAESCVENEPVILEHELVILPAVVLQSSTITEGELSEVEVKKIQEDSSEKHPEQPANISVETEQVAEAESCVENEPVILEHELVMLPAVVLQSSAITEGELSEVQVKIVQEDSSETLSEKHPERPADISVETEQVAEAESCVENEPVILEHELLMLPAVVLQSSAIAEDELSEVEVKKVQEDSSEKHPEGPANISVETEQVAEAESCVENEPVILEHELVILPAVVLQSSTIAEGELSEVQVKIVQEDSSETLSEKHPERPADISVETEQVAEAESCVENESVILEHELVILPAVVLQSSTIAEGELSEVQVKIVQEDSSETLSEKHPERPADISVENEQVAEAESCVENEPVILEHKLVMLPVVVLQSSAIAEGELSEVEVNKVQEDSSETLSEKHPEGPANISVETEQVAESCMESEPVILEHEFIMLPAVVLQSSAITEGELSEVEVKKVQEDSSEQHPEGPANISVETEQVAEAESCVENEPVILEHELVMLPAVVLQSSAITEGELSEVQVKIVQEDSSEKHPEGPANISVETEQVVEAESCVENEPVILEHKFVMPKAVILQSSAITEGELSEVEVKKVQEDSSETLSEKHPEWPANISVETEQVVEAESCVEHEPVILEHKLVMLPAVVLQSSAIAEGELSEVEVKKVQEDSSEQHPEGPANISVETEQVAEAESCVENEPVILEHELVMLPAVVLQSSAITEGELSEVQVKIVQEDSSETLSEKHPEQPADISVETEQVAEAESCVENEPVILEHKLVMLPAVVLQSSAIAEDELSEVEVKKVQEDSSEKHPEGPANISVETEQVAEAESCVENEPVILEHKFVMPKAVILQSSAIAEGELSEVEVKKVQEDSSETLSEKHPEWPANISVETEQVAEAESCVENEPVILEHELVMLPAVVLQSSAITEGELSEVQVKIVQEDSSETLSEKHPEQPADISVENEQVAEAESCVENEPVILEHKLLMLPAVVLQSSAIAEDELSEVEVKKVQEDSSEQHPEGPANISVETEQVAEAESCVENEPVILEHELVMPKAVILQSSAIAEGELSEVEVKKVQEDSSETLSEKHPERPADISVETDQVAEAESCVENKPVILEHELVMLPAVVLESSAIAEGELSEVELKKVQEDSSETLSEKHPEGPGDISVETEQVAEAESCVENEPVILEHELVMLPAVVLQSSAIAEDELSEVEVKKVQEDSSEKHPEGPANISVETEQVAEAESCVENEPVILEHTFVMPKAVILQSSAIAEGELSEVEVKKIQEDSSETLSEKHPEGPADVSVETEQVAEAESCVENEPVILEHELVMLPAVVLESSAIAEGELSEVELKKVQEDSSETLSEKHPEGPANISVETEQEKSENMATPHVPETLADVSIHEDKEHLEEAKVDLKEVSEVIEEDSKHPSQASILEKLNDVEEQITKASSYQVMECSNTGLASQNTGIVSSVGNVGSPSSLSLEFKLNIHFGQTTVTASSPTVIERTETLKQTEVTEAGVQVTEKEQPIAQIKDQEESEILEQPELTDIGVESFTETVTIERAETAQQPVVEVGVQATETAEPVRQTEEIEIVETQEQEVGIQATEPVRQTETIDRVETPEQPEPSEVCVQAMEATEPVKQTETGQIEEPVVPNQPVQADVCVQATETMEPAENDQDVWQDAEENIYIQEPKSWIKPVESVESQKEDYQPEKEILEHGMAHHSHTEVEGESQHDASEEATGTCESESEDFDVALEPEIHTAVEVTDTTVEWK